MRRRSTTSRMLSLITRSFEPPPGTIFLDGRPIETIPIHQLREWIGMVPQETFLFSATIEENLKFGRQDQLSFEAVEEAAKAAQVDGEIRRVPGRRNQNHSSAVSAAPIIETFRPCDIRGPTGRAFPV